MINLIKVSTITLAIILAPFALAIIISWNALPEDRFYPLKRRLEQVALKVSSPSFALNNNLQNKLIGRRADEASKTLTYRQSSAGLYELKDQISTTYKQTKNIKDESKKQKAAQNLLTQLKETKHELKEIKESIKVEPKPTHLDEPDPTNTTKPPTPKPSQTTHPLPIPTKIPNLPSPPSDDEPGPGDIIDDIDDDIDDIIDDLEGELIQPDMNMQEGQKLKKNKDDDKKDRDEKKGQ